MIAALAAAILFTAIGAPLLALAGIDRPALAPATGIAAAGVVLATAATVGLEIGPVALAIAAAVLIAIAMWQRGLPRLPRPSFPALILAAWTLLQAAIAANTPLSAFDGLVTWAFKAHALLAFDARLAAVRPRPLPGAAPRVPDPVARDPGDGAADQRRLRRRRPARQRAHRARLPAARRLTRCC